MFGSVFVSNFASGPVGGTSDIVFASDHGLYGMSGSFPLIRPPGSAALRLCPNSPKIIAQSPDRSAAFDVGSGDGGPIGRKFFCSRSAADGVVCGACAPATAETNPAAR